MWILGLSDHSQWWYSWLKLTTYYWGGRWILGLSDHSQWWYSWLCLVRNRGKGRKVLSPHGCLLRLPSGLKVLLLSISNKVTFWANLFSLRCWHSGLKEEQPYHMGKRCLISFTSQTFKWLCLLTYPWH